MTFNIYHNIVSPDFVVTQAPDVTFTINHLAVCLNGMPAGGLEGEILVKKTDSDFDVEWSELPPLDPTDVAKAIDEFEETGVADTDLIVLTSARTTLVSSLKTLFKNAFDLLYQRKKTDSESYVVFPEEPAGDVLSDSGGFITTTSVVSSGIDASDDVVPVDTDYIALAGVRKTLVSSLKTFFKTDFDLVYQPLKEIYESYVIFPETPIGNVLSDNGTFIAPIVAVGGYANNLFFSNVDVASPITTPTTKRLDYVADINASTISQTITLAEGNKLFRSFMYTEPISEAVFPAGLFSFSLFCRISSAAGVSNIGVRYFRYTLLGEKIYIFPDIAWSQSLENTTDQYITFNYTTGTSTQITAGDRSGCDVYLKTSTSASKTVTMTLGDGNASYLNNPNTIRHTNLRAKNQELAYQHVDSTVTKSEPIAADKLALWDSVAGAVVMLSSSFYAKLSEVEKLTASFIMSLFNSYKTRVLSFLGVVQNDANTKAFIKMCYDNGMLDSIKIALLGEAGSKFRVSGIYSYFTNIYSMFVGIDAAQTTSTSQPFLSGNIAPTERLCLKNPNGGNNFLTHPTISFGSGDSWSVTTVVNWNGNSENFQVISGDSSINLTAIYIGINNTNNFAFRNSIGESGLGVINKSKSVIGKNKIITFIANGDNHFSIFIDGIFSEAILISTGAIFNIILRVSLLASSRVLQGGIYLYIIREQALTPAQVLIQDGPTSLLRSWYPEIPSVTIGSKTIASSNLEVVCNALGTLVPDGALTTNWITGTAFWCYHTDITTGSVFGKLYNKSGKNVIVASPPDGWHVATKAENTALAALGSAALKMSSANWWLTSNGTNTTGYTALGGGKRNADGSFSILKNDAYFWCADSDEVLHITDAGVATIEAITNVNDGYSIRLIKN